MKTVAVVALLLSSTALILACSGNVPEEVATDQAPLVSDASSMVQRPDGLPMFPWRR